MAKYRLKGTDFYTGSSRIGRLKGADLHDGHNKRLGKVKGTKIFDAHGKAVGAVKGSYL